MTIKSSSLLEVTRLVGGGILHHLQFTTCAIFQPQVLWSLQVPHTAQMRNLSQSATLTNQQQSTVQNSQKQESQQNVASQTILDNFSPACHESNWKTTPEIFCTSQSWGQCHNVIDRHRDQHIQNLQVDIRQWTTSQGVFQQTIHGSNAYSGWQNAQQQQQQYNTQFIRGYAKGGKMGGGNKDKRINSSKKLQDFESEVQAVNPDFDISRGKDIMEKGIKQFEQSMTSLRLGRAYPDMLDHLTVNTSEGPIPLPRVAMVSLMDAATLVITVTEKNTLGSVQKAISESPYELNPVKEDDQTLMVEIPRPTKRTKDALIKVLHEQGESAKKKVREGRKLGNDMSKKQLASKAALKSAEGVVQKYHDHYVDQIMRMLKQKENEIESFI